MENRQEDVAWGDFVDELELDELEEEDDEEDDEESLFVDDESLVVEDDDSLLVLEPVSDALCEPRLSVR